MEAGIAADVQHRPILSQDRAHNALQLFLPSDMDERVEQLRAEAPMLPRIGNEQRKFCFMAAAPAIEAADADDLARSVPALVFGDQRNVAVVVREALAHHPAMLCIVGGQGVAGSSLDLSERVSVPVISNIEMLENYLRQHADA